MHDLQVVGVAEPVGRQRQQQVVVQANLLQGVLKEEGLEIKGGKRRLAKGAKGPSFAEIGKKIRR